MSKTFNEWIKERRVTITLPSGIEAVIRVPSTWKAAELGPLPGIEDMTDSRRGVTVYRRYVETCLVSLGSEEDPIGRGLCVADDFSFDDGNAIMDAAISLVGKREVADDEAPLGDTGLQDVSPG